MTDARNDQTNDAHDALMTDMPNEQSSEPSELPSEPSEADQDSRAAPAGPGEDTNSGTREAVDPVGGTSGSPLSHATDAVADAGQSFVQRVSDAADRFDVDDAVRTAKSTADDLIAKVKDAYRERPGVVIGAGVAVMLVAVAIARSVGRR